MNIKLILSLVICFDFCFYTSVWPLWYREMFPLLYEFVQSTCLFGHSVLVPCITTVAVSITLFITQFRLWGLFAVRIPCIRLPRLQLKLMFTTDIIKPAMRCFVWWLSNRCWHATPLQWFSKTYLLYLCHWWQRSNWYHCTTNAIKSDRFKL